MIIIPIIINVNSKSAIIIRGSGFTNTIFSDQEIGKIKVICSEQSELPVELLLKLDEYNICASAGSACSTGESSPSHVLTAIGLLV